MTISEIIGICLLAVLLVAVPKAAKCIWRKHRGGPPCSKD